MRYLLFFMILFSSTVCFADREIYVVERPDGSLAIHNYYPNKNVSAEQSLKDNGLEGLPYKKVSESEIPVKDDSRDFWILNPDPSGPVIIVDEQAKEKKETDKQAVYDKLKITKEELKLILGDI